MYLGNVVHRQLAKAYSLGAEGVLYPLDDMIEAFKAEWEKTGKEKITVANEYLTVDDYIHNGEEMLRHYYERYRPFNQGKLLGAEQRIRFQLPGSNFQFIAIIDRLWKTDDKVVEICDYKTGKNLPLGGGDPSFSIQMGLYQLAVQSVYPQFDQIELAQYFLRHDEVIRHRMRPDEIDELTEKLRQEVLSTVRSERMDDFPCRESMRCNYCEYFRLCPAKRHRRVLEDEDKEEGEELSTMQSAAELADRFVELDGEYKMIRAEHGALREDVIRMARELGLEKLVGTEGEVSVRSKQEEKFVSRSADPEAFVRLTQLVRDWRLDECLTLDEKALMKDVYRTERLTSEQLERLREFISTRESSRVSVRRLNTSEDDDV